MQQWEYKIFGWRSHPDLPDQHLTESKLAIFGQEGWELVSIATNFPQFHHRDEVYGTAYFKRPVET